MKSIFSILGLIIVLVFVGFLVKSQLADRYVILKSQTAPVASSPLVVNVGTVQQQVKQAVEDAMHQERSALDDK